MTSHPSFDNQGLLVIDGTQGIAPQVILLAAQRHATVVFTAPPGGESSAEAVVTWAQAAGFSDRVSYITTRLTGEEAVEQVVDTALERLPSLDVLIHNLEPEAVLDQKALVDISLDEWNRVLSSELSGPFMFARRVVEEYLVSRVNGRIVYITYSGSALQRVPASYATTQTALRALIRCITKEFGRREVGCNGVVICRDAGTAFPTFADPNAQSEDAAAASSELLETVLFLASREASFVNGEFLEISSSRRDISVLNLTGSEGHARG